MNADKILLAKNLRDYPLFTRRIISAVLGNSSASARICGSTAAFRLNPSGVSR